MVNAKKKEANPNVIIYLVGNKKDIDEELKIVPTEDGQQMADEYNCF